MPIDIRLWLNVRDRCAGREDAEGNESWRAPSCSLPI
jgi:hypothetical protein